MEYSSNKQKLLVEYLISSADTFAMCKSIVKADYFEPSLRQTVEFVHEYYDKYSAIPTPDQIEAETDVKVKTQTITRDQIEYCTNEIEGFCRRMALQQAIYSAPEMIAEGKYAEVEQRVKDAISVSLNKDLGLQYFEDPFGRTEAEASQPQRTSTGWRAFDDVLYGGLARTEMLLLTANSGGGKSIALANLAVNFTLQGFNVLYLTLELSESLVAKRFDTMYTGTPSPLWAQQHQNIAATLTAIKDSVGKLTIKYMPTGTNANAIRGYLKEFELSEGYIPDLLIVDYLDLMGANEKVSADNIWEKDKRAAEQLRDIGNYYNLFIATASQQNRAALDAEELHQGHIAGGISKVNTVDIHASIVLNSAMKAEGVIGFVFLKTRSSDGVGKTIYLDWDNTSLRIQNPKGDVEVDEDGVIIDKIAHSKQKAKQSKKLTLNGLMEL